jgi:hypothetical protein
LYSETGRTDIELEPTTQIGNAVISAWSRASSRPDSLERALWGLEKLKREAKDDLISYNTVLDAMSKKGLAKDAMELLQWLEAESKKRRGSLAPDLVSYNSVLAAIGRSSKDDPAVYVPALEAERLLRNMRVKPDKLSYTCM